MIRTYLEAERIARTGDFERAWEIAKQDEGMNPDVTKEQWISFIKDMIKDRA